MLHTDDENSPEQHLNDPPANPAKSVRKPKKSRPKPDSVVAPFENPNHDKPPLDSVADVVKEKRKPSRTSERRAEPSRTDKETKRRSNAEGTEERPPPAVVISNGILSVQSVQLAPDHGRHRELTELAASQLVSQLLGKLQPNESVPSIKRLREPTAIQAEDLLDDIVAEVAAKRESQSVSLEEGLTREDSVVRRSREPTTIQAEKLIESVLQDAETSDQNANAVDELKTTNTTGYPSEEPNSMVVVPVDPEHLRKDRSERLEARKLHENRATDEQTGNAAKNLPERVVSGAEDSSQNPENAQKGKSSKVTKGSKKKSRQRDSADTSKPSHEPTVLRSEKPLDDIKPLGVVSQSGSKTTVESMKKFDAQENVHSRNRSREPTVIQAETLLDDIVVNAELNNGSATGAVQSNPATITVMPSDANESRASREISVPDSRMREPTEFQAEVLINDIISNEEHKEDAQSVLPRERTSPAQSKVNATNTEQSRAVPDSDQRAREPTEVEAKVLLNGIIADGESKPNVLPIEIMQAAGEISPITPPPAPEQLPSSPAQSTTVKDAGAEKKKRSESAKAKKKRKESKVEKDSAFIPEPIDSTAKKEEIESAEINTAKGNDVPLQIIAKQADTLDTQLETSATRVREDMNTAAEKEILQSTEATESIVSTTVVPVSSDGHPALAVTVVKSQKPRSSKKLKKAAEVKTEQSEVKPHDTATEAGASDQRQLTPVGNVLTEARDVPTQERRTKETPDNVRRGNVDLSIPDAAVQERALSLAQDTALAQELMEEVEKVIANTRVSFVNETPTTATTPTEEILAPKKLPSANAILDEFADRPRPKHRRTIETSRPNSRQLSGQKPAGERKLSTPVDNSMRVKEERTASQEKQMSKRVTLPTESPETPDTDKHKHKPKKFSTTTKGQPDLPAPIKTVEPVQPVRRSVKPDIDLPLSELIRQSIAENAQVERKKDNTPLSELIRQSIVEPTISAETVAEKADALGEAKKRKESRKQSVIVEKVAEKVREDIPFSEIMRKSLVERSNEKQAKDRSDREDASKPQEPISPTSEAPEGAEKKRRKSRTKKKDVLPLQEAHPVVTEPPVPLVPLTLTPEGRDEGSLLKDLSMEQLTMKLEESLEDKRKPLKPSHRRGTRPETLQADENAVPETSLDLPKPEEVPKPVSPVPGAKGPRPLMRRPMPRRPGAPAQNDGTQTPGGLRPRPGARSAPTAEPEAKKIAEATVVITPPVEEPPPDLVEKPPVPPENDGEAKKKHRKHRSPVEGEDVEERHHGHKKKRKKPKGKRHKEDQDDDEEAAETSTRKGDPLYGQSVGNFFVLEDVLGKGGFGEARRGRHITSTKKFAIKLERIADANESLAEEYKIYQIIGQHVGFPRCYYFGVGPMEHNALVMDLLGPSLEDYFRAMERKWSLKTVCLVAIQILERIEYVHSKGYVYSDIKPENFLAGLPEEHLDGTVYLIDFGLAQQFKDKDTGKYCYDENLKTHPIGTMRYMSVRSHEGRSQSYRDDLESIGYLIIYFLRGRLPWQGLGIKDRQKKVKAVGLKKKTIPLDELCQNCPPQLQDYIKYVRSIQFYAEPKYDRLRGFFGSVMQANGWVDDGLVDWMGREFDFAKNKKSDSGFGKPGSEDGEAEETVVETRKSVVKVPKVQKTLVEEEGEGPRTVVRKRVSPPTRVGMDPTIDPLLAFNEQENKRKLAAASTPKKPEPSANEDDYFTHRQREQNKPRRHREDHGGCYCC